MVPSVACWRMKASQGQRAGGERFSGSGGWSDLKGRVLEDEGFSGAECWRMKGSQGQSAGG